MPRNSKVTPARLVLNPKNRLANSDKELQYLMNYVNSKNCYHSSAAAHAKIIAREQKIAFQVEIWTLMEKRSVQSKEKPFDNKPAPAEDLGDIFDKKYAYDTPDTVLSERKRESYDLNNTRKKLLCPSCQGKGLTPCFLCNENGEKFGKACMVCNGEGSSVCKQCSKVGHVVRWQKLKIEWYTLYTISFPKTTFLPDELIKQQRNKQMAFDGDDKCLNQSLDSTFPNLLKEINAKSPHNFAPYVEKQFLSNHFDKADDSTRIRRIKCLIQKLDITAVDYQSGTLKNTKDAQNGPETFTFLLYGGDKNNDPEVYERDYPMNSCGCLGAACACHSKICTIA